MPKVSICLVSYNGERYLPYCLASIADQSYTDWEFLALDNRSGDASAEIIAKFCSQGGNRSFQGKKDKNIGFAGGYNELMRKAHGEYIFLVNQDTRLDATYLERCIACLEEHPDASSVTGLIARWEFDRYGGELPPVDSRIIDTAGLRVKPTFRIVDKQAGEKYFEIKEVQEIFGVSGALPVYRKKVLESVGFFDESFFAYKEDVDVAFRLRHAGWKSYCVKSALAFHDRGLGGNEKTSLLQTSNSHRSRISFGQYLSERNHWFVLIKNVALSDWLRYGVFIFFYQAAKAVHIILFEPRTIRAWIDVVRAVPRLLRERRRIQPRSVGEWVKGK